MSVSVKGVRLWNKLDVAMHDVKSVKAFKNKLKAMYISTYE